MTKKMLNVNQPGALHPAVRDFVCKTMNEGFPCTMEVKNGTVTLVKAYIKEEAIWVETKPSGVTAEEYDLDSVIRVVTQIRLKDKVSK